MGILEETVQKKTRFHILLVRYIDESHIFHPSVKINTNRSKEMAEHPRHSYIVWERQLNEIKHKQAIDVELIVDGKLGKYRAKQSITQRRRQDVHQ